ncbi:MAG: hydroxypyruvate isomerase [Akkermansiaceae bacterium]|jgi:hydroxypyruvate isomerase
MELLNSKVDHPDYQCDHTDWGIALCQKLGSPRFKLLYDIYHMQVMEGNVMATIRRAAPYIGHYHTAGCPGRHELDGTQELHYPAIIKAINDTGYTGFLAHEFIPTWPDQKAALQDAKHRCCEIPW